MLDLEENSKLLENIDRRFKNLGESLWHRKSRKRVRKFRKTNIRRRFLER